LTSRKILIVEDRGDLLDLLDEALNLLGWETILAENDREALDKLAGEIPNVMFLNLRTPVIDGIKLAASLKAHPAYTKIPILAASWNCGGLTREHCLALGFDDFISKPLMFDELEMRLNNILALERRKNILAINPVNLPSDGWKRSSRGAGRRRVA